MLRAACLARGAASVAPRFLAAHLAAPQASPAAALAHRMRGEQADAVRRRRLLFRARQRGWLEVDVVLGHWVAAHVADMSEGEVAVAEKLLTAETPELYRWIVRGEPPPDGFDSDVLRDIVAFARGETAAQG